MSLLGRLMAPLCISRKIDDKAAFKGSTGQVKARRVRPPAFSQTLTRERRDMPALGAGYRLAARFCGMGAA